MLISRDEFIEKIKNGGCYIDGGRHIHGGCDIYGGCDIDGGRSIHGGCDILFCSNCYGVYECILCHDYTGKFSIFNTQISETEYNKIKNKINELRNGWYPKFTNAEQLYNENGQKWECVPPHKIESRTNAEAYADMPKNLIAYIKSLPYFNAEIFEKITGINLEMGD